MGEDVRDGLRFFNDSVREVEHWAKTAAAAGSGAIKWRPGETYRGDHPDIWRIQQIEEKEGE